MEPSATPGIIIGLDAGESGHRAYALTNTDERIYDRPLPQDEAARHEIFASTQVHNSILMVVSQHNTIGALPITIARDCGCIVGDLPDPAIRKAAGLYPRRPKTDHRDAFITADAAHTMPYILRATDRNNETLAALKILARFHDNIAKDATRTKNRLYNMLAQTHPELERIFVDEILSHTLMLDSLIHYGDRQN